METASRDVLIKIALELDYIDILSWCVSNKHVNEKVCKNQDFWRILLYKDYSFIPKNFKSKDNRKLYKLLRETIVSKNVYNKPVYISENMKQFLQNTDFGSYKLSTKDDNVRSFGTNYKLSQGDNHEDNDVPISEILNLTLDKNILSRPALTTLITYYLRGKKSRNDETFLKIDEHMDKYLGKDLDFDKQRFQYNKIRSIIAPNILKDGNKDVLEEYRELVNKTTEIIKNFFISN